MLELQKQSKRMETKYPFPEELTRVLSDKPITDDDIKNHDTYITKYNGKSFNLVPIAKWIVSSNVMKNHGKFCDRSILEKYELYCDNSDNYELDKSGSLDILLFENNKIIVFAVVISENIWSGISDKYTIEKLYDLLKTFQIFDIKLTKQIQKKIAYNYLLEIKEEGENRWNKINSFDISILADCSQLFRKQSTEILSKELISKTMEYIRNYFAKGIRNDEKIDIERINKLVHNYKNIPRYESIIDLSVFIDMLRICFHNEYYYLFSEIYCTIISIPGSAYIFDINVAKIYSEWVEKFSQKNPNIKKTYRIHEAFQYMAVKNLFIDEVLNMCTGTCQKLELSPELNFCCPCYMLPFTRGCSSIMDSCDDHKCRCKTRILQLDEIKERLNIFVGGYLNDLDLSKSAITGSAMACCPFISEIERRYSNFCEFTDTLYSKTRTCNTPISASDLRDLVYFKYINKRDPPSTIKNKRLIFDEMKQYSKLCEKSVEIMSGTDIDIMVNIDDIKEFDEIAQKHINVIRKKYPQINVIKKETSGKFPKYRIMFPNFEQRNVEIYASNVTIIATHHYGCVRAYYSKIYGTEQLSYYPSYLMTIFTNVTPDIRFNAGKISHESIIEKYNLRGFRQLHYNKFSIGDRDYDNIETIIYYIKNGRSYDDAENKLLKKIGNLDLRCLFNMMNHMEYSKISKHSGTTFLYNIEGCSKIQYPGYSKLRENELFVTPYYLLDDISYA